jgi:hypothetical protein
VNEVQRLGILSNPAQFAQSKESNPEILKKKKSQSICKEQEGKPLKFGPNIRQQYMFRGYFLTQFAQSKFLS